MPKCSASWPCVMLISLRNLCFLHYRISAYFLVNKASKYLYLVWFIASINGLVYFLVDGRLEDVGIDVGVNYFTSVVGLAVIYYCWVVSKTITKLRT